MRESNRWLDLGGCLVLVPLGLILVARMVAWDSRTVLVAINTLAPLLLLAAWPVAIVAAIARRWALPAAAALVITAQVALALPELLASEPIPGAARSAPTFRVFNANVYAGNGHAAGYAEEIRRSRPDLVVLQEATPAFLATLDATGALADLPHRVTVSRSDPFAAVVVSRWSLSEDDVLDTRGRPVLVRATVQIGPTPIRIFAFHAVSPVGGTREQWVEDLEVLRAAVAAERRPVLVAGDFNATWGHRHFRRILDAGLTDAAAARGQPYQMTWPRNRSIVPAVARIDHVLTSDRLVTTRITTGKGRGSDHRPLVADVAVT